MAKNPFLVVSVARDVNVKIIKGQNPMFSEQQRLRGVRSCPLVDKAVLGGFKNYIPHIAKEKPAIIALGYDQKAYTKNLKKVLNKENLDIKVVRLRAFKPQVYKSSLTKRILGYSTFVL